MSRTWTAHLARVVRVVIYIFLIGPILVVVGSSFTNSSYATFPPKGLSLRWYDAAVHSSDFLHGAVLSLILAAVTAAVVTPIGLLVAVALSSLRSSVASALGAVFLLPLLVPTVVTGVALLQFFSKLGLLGSPWALLLGDLVVTLPYSVRLGMTGLADFNWSLFQASRNLGASGFYTWRRIVLPLISPAVASATAFSFVIAFDEVVVSLFLSGPNYQPLSVKMLTFVEQSNSPIISVFGVGLLLISVLFFVVLDRTIGVGRVFGSSRR